MAVIKFGTQQLKNPTPAKINLGVRIFTIVAGIFLGWMQTDTLINIEPHARAVTCSILGLLLAIANGIAPLFGVNTSQTVIPKEDVAAMTTS
jgi:hypothetical protein